MVTWNYRIIDHGEWFGLHEVFYKQEGSPGSLTVKPIDFVCDKEDGPDGIIRSLENAMADARSRPILKASDFPLPEVVDS